MQETCAVILLLIPHACPRPSVPARRDMESQDIVLVRHEGINSVPSWGRGPGTSHYRSAPSVIPFRRWRRCAVANRGKSPSVAWGDLVDEVHATSAGGGLDDGPVDPLYGFQHRFHPVTATSTNHPLLASLNSISRSLSSLLNTQPVRRLRFFPPQNKIYGYLYPSDS